MIFDSGTKRTTGRNRLCRVDNKAVSFRVCHHDATCMGVCEEKFSYFVGSVTNL